MQSEKSKDIVMVTFVVPGGYKRVSDAAFACGMTTAEFIARAIEAAVLDVERDNTREEG